MQWIKTIVREIYGLFVDDAGFALAIFLWLALAWFAMARLAHRIPPRAAAVIFFCGLAALLILSAVRFARSHPRR
jgi:hypothetical protein